MERFSKIQKEEYYLYANSAGLVIGVGLTMGNISLYIEEFVFKDLSCNSKLDPYKDWRLPLEERVADLTLSSRTCVDLLRGAVELTLNKKEQNYEY